jgi:hypothetical protein
MPGLAIATDLDAAELMGLFDGFDRHPGNLTVVPGIS